ncbi:FecR domain-containing protein [Thalassotalea fonticola]|uniref:FecR domain-containing protein n=1 Tax=Thalassotalea fonticola TaxID=3065649 RepID=A0ABZ0GTL8_9GAMM|nr:FecR domain-containing protein [Colwelliaceae bacterium S1-1]
MNKQSQIVTLRSPEIINRESADWLAKMDGDNMDQAEKLALKNWLNESPEHAIALKNHMSMWDDMTEVLNDSGESFMAEATNPEYFSWLRNVFSPKPVMLAMSCMFLLILSGVLIVSPWSARNVETAFYLTNVGVQQSYQLSDGSTALLNTDSRIEIEFSDGQRIVRLQQGEAMFDVAHDKDRPFIVYAAGSAVRAVGTEFVVRLASENILVTVTEGTVELSQRENMAKSNEEKSSSVAVKPEPMLLHQGEQAEYVVENATFVAKQINETQINEQLSWLDGQLVFKEERLENVIKEINRYLDTDILILSPKLKDIPISGRFQIGETEALLEAIEITFDIDVDMSNNQIYLSKYSNE